MDIQKLLAQSVIKINLQAQTRDEAFKELASLLHEKNLITDPDDTFKRLLHRESMASTAIGEGFAIPHANISDLEEVSLAIGKSEKGIDFSAIDAQKVYLIMMVLFPEGKEKLHVQILARFARILNSEKHRLELKNSQSPDEIRRVFQTQNSEVN